MSVRGLLPFLLLVLPTISIASDFTEYRIPPSSWRRYAISAGGDWSRSTSVRPRESDRTGVASGNVRAEYSIGRDSDAIQWDAAVSGSVEGDRRHEVSDHYDAFPLSGPPSSTFATTDRDRRRSLDESWFVGLATRYYPGSGPLGIELRGSAGGRYRQAWSVEDSRYESSGFGAVMVSESRGSEVRWNYHESVALDAGLGVGRVRDASAVFLVLLLEERLTRDRVLLRPLSSDERRRLAELFSLRGEFSLVHQLPNKFFWGEVERQLRASGALAEAGLDGFAAMHADEGLVVVRSGFSRRTGWFAGPVVSAYHNHDLFRADDATSSRTAVNGSTTSETYSRNGTREVFSLEALYAGGRAELHVPLDARTQFGVTEEALVEVTGEDEGLRVYGQARLQRLVGERWFAETYALHQRVILGESSYDLSNWAAVVGGAVSYFLEDRTRLNLSVDQNWAGMESGATFPNRERRNDLRVRLGVTVGRGIVDAPGIPLALRPLP